MEEGDIKASSTTAPSGREHQIANRYRGVQPVAFSTTKSECSLWEQFDELWKVNGEKIVHTDF
ncbi:MAG: hypothetical protein KDD67_10915 [Ignavibacteriae bacterium]|nr:hypothetical protein [Ignavibacteriota bacterium]MCB9215800.1 hypothetical protein [Ignavibacteria bacterium]